MRGLAALQVVLLHYCAAFLPAAARAGTPQHYVWEIAATRSPLFFLIDGYSAVYIFFLMSGFVLTPSFTRSDLGIAQQVGKRYLRLYLPVAAAFLSAVALMLIMPGAKAAAYAFSRSSWLISQYQHSMQLGSLMKDGLLNSMLLGYEGVSIFAGIPAITRWLPLSPMSASMDAPLWTLHAEYWGSMLVLLTAQLYRHLPRGLFWPLFLAAIAFTGTSHFTLFLLGFLAYVIRAPILRAPRSMASIAGLAAIVLGIYSCALSGSPLPARVLDAAARFTYLRGYSAFHFQNEAGAVFIFLGVLMYPAVRDLLSKKTLLWLGKVSFSVYLLHYPILFTAGCAIFAMLAPYGYASGILVALTFGGLLTLALAALFEAFIDQPSIEGSRRFASALQSVVDRRLGRRAGAEVR